MWKDIDKQDSSSANDRHEAAVIQARKRIPWKPWATIDRPGDSLPSFEIMLDILNDRSGERWREQEAAAWQIGRMELTDEQRRQAIHALVLFMEDKKYDWERHGNRVLYLIWFVASLIPFLLYMSNSPRLDYALSAALICIVFGSFVTLPTTLAMDHIYFARFQRVRYAIARTLSSLKAHQGISPLLRFAVCEPFDMDVRALPSLLKLKRIAAETLPDILATLTPDANSSHPFMPNLCRALSHSNEKLVLSALEALGKVGDGQAVTPVQRCAKRDNRPKVRETAQRILPLLQERQRNEQAPQMLLRPSSALDTPADQLLRAASGVAPVNPGELLRPNDNPPAPPKR